MKSGNLLPSKILVKRIEKGETVTRAGLVILENANKDPNITALVNLIGDNVNTILSPSRPLNIGDQILFNPHAFQRVRIQEEDFLLVDCKDLLFYFTPESVA